MTDLLETAFSSYRSSATAGAPPSSKPSMSAVSQAEGRLHRAGLPLWLVARLDGSGTVHKSLFHWLSIALGPPPLSERDAEASDAPLLSEVERQEAWALRNLCRMAQAQMSLLDEAVREATALLIKQGTSSAAEGGSTIKAHQNTLLEVAVGAVKATSASVQRLSAFC